MKKKIQSLLEELWAKDDGTTIREHTEKLLNNLANLKRHYEKEIDELIPKELPTELRKRFWEILRLACEYHDYGKIHCKFQKKIGNENIELIKNLPEVRHNLLSPLFVVYLCEEDELTKDIVSLLVLHHHPVENNLIKIDEVADVIQKEFRQNFGFGFDISSIKLLLKMPEERYIKEATAEEFGIEYIPLLKYYRLLKGLLLRIDHASSSKHAQEVEDEPPGDTLSFVDEFFKKHRRTPYEMQIFVRDNRDKNLVIIAPTGAGKTEAGFIYIQKKGFFMLPYRVSANGIYMRAEGIFRNEENGNNRNYAGLLHSSALSYVLEREENREDVQNNQEDTAFLNYFLSRNFAKPIIISTPDQLMHFVFRYKGFEKYYATALYSRLVIDELQSYDPITLAFIVQGLEVLAQNGGKFLVMTATFPEFLRKGFESMGVVFKPFNTQKEQYHHVQVIDDSIDNHMEKMIELSHKAKVLVVVNTVKKAIELKEKFEKAGLQNVKLLHSRFILKDRKEKEREIMKFFDSQEKGLWITTQLAEVSLDLDADYLFTELSTADSLIQRMGRCNRRGQKSTNEPNVFVFTKDCSGVGSVYYKHLHESTLKNLKDELKNLKDELWNWNFKWGLVEKVYSESALEGTEYWKNFKRAESYIKNLWEGADSLIRSKSEAIKLFRDINAVQVIPERFKQDVEKPLQEWEKAKGDFVMRTKLLNDILEYSFSLPVWSFEKLEKQKIHHKLNIYYIEGDYREDTGFMLEPKVDLEQREEEADKKQKDNMI
jgi:CRISPR-associated endonuclease/helicase Cas3